MEMTQPVSTPTHATPGLINDLIKAGGMLMLATIWVDLKPERVQESLAADGTDAPSLSLQLAIHQSQTVTFGLSASGLTLTFNNGISTDGSAAPAA